MAVTLPDARQLSDDVLEALRLRAIHGCELGFTEADVADLLVKRGMPFRAAHGVVAGVVRGAVDAGKSLSELTEEELAELAPDLDSEFYELLRDGAWLESKVSEGGTSLARVKDQLGQARHILEED